MDGMSCGWLAGALVWFAPSFSLCFHLFLLLSSSLLLPTSVLSCSLLSMTGDFFSCKSSACFVFIIIIYVIEDRGFVLIYVMI